MYEGFVNKYCPLVRAYSTHRHKQTIISFSSVFFFSNLLCLQRNVRAKRVHRQELSITKIAHLKLCLPLLDTTACCCNTLACYPHTHYTLYICLYGALCTPTYELILKLAIKSLNCMQSEWCVCMMLFSRSGWLCWLAGSLFLLFFAVALCIWMYKFQLDHSFKMGTIGFAPSHFFNLHNVYFIIFNRKYSMNFGSFK